MSGEVRVVDQSGRPVDFAFSEGAYHAALRRPILVIGGDHPYSQWWGTNGRDGLAQMYLDRGITPYIAINTDDENAPGRDHMMTWAQCAALQALGVEFVAHGAWHVDKWNRINTGIRVQYTGTGTSATVQVQTAVPSTALVCTAGADSVTSTFASDTTLSAVKATIEANGKWTVTLDAILLGTEASTNLLGMNAARTLVATVTFSSSSGLLATTAVDYPTGWPVTFATSGGTLPSNITAGTTYYAIRVSATTCRLATSLANALSGTAISYVDAGTPTNTISFGQSQYLCAGGGLELTYNSTNPPSRYSHVWARHTSSANFSVFGDGPQNYNHTGSTGSLSTLASNVRALVGAEFRALLCDDGAYSTDGTTITNKPTYMFGDELETNLHQTNYVEFGSRPGLMEAGLSQPYIIRRHMQRVVDVAASNGITIKHFAQSGGNFYEWMATDSVLGMHRGNPLYRSTTPFPARRDKLGNFIVHRTLTNNETGQTYYGENIAAIPSALAGHGSVQKCEPWVMCLLMHVLKADGSSGYSITSLPSGYFDQYEADWVTFLDAVKAQVTAGTLRTMTFDELSKIPRTSAPTNLWFNPGLQNGGASRAPAAGAQDGGFWVPGALIIRASTVSSLTISSGAMRWVNSSATATEIINQYVILETGKTYEVSCDFKQVAYTSGAGLQWSVQALHGNVKDLIQPDDNWKFTGEQKFQSGRVAMRFQVPASRGWIAPKVVAGYLSQTATFSSSTGLLMTVGTSIPALSKITFSAASGGALPTGLTLYTTYWTISTGTTSKLATSLANAIAGTAIAYTDAGSGTITAQYIPATYDLSVNKNIKIAVIGGGTTADIDCSGGTAAATTAKEIAAKINAAIAADSYYSQKAEYHNIATVVDGRLTLTAPYIGTDQGSSLAVSAGSSASAVAAIFGNATVDGRAQFVGAMTSEQFTFRLALRAAFAGTAEVRDFDLREVGTAF